MPDTKRRKQAKILRISRSIHRTMGVFLCVCFFFMAISGTLLGWKKNSNGYILPNSAKGTSTTLKNWLSVDSLQTIAFQTLHDSISTELSTKLDRIDIRKHKGIVKFVFKDHFWGIQLDGATGKVLSIGHRKSDLIEKIHDGSILDYYAGTSGQFKLIYSSIMGLSLLMFTITGFWLWYGPKRMRKAKKNRHK